MDHLGYGGWKTGLQGDQGVAGGYTMDPGYPLLAPSAPLLAIPKKDRNPDFHLPALPRTGDGLGRDPPSLKEP